MAVLWRRSSRTIANHIRKYMNYKGFIGAGSFVNQSCRLYSLGHRPFPDIQHSLARNRTTLFSVRQRFESTIAEKQLDSIFSSDSEDDQVSTTGPACNCVHELYRLLNGSYWGCKFLYLAKEDVFDLFSKNVEDFTTID